MEENEPNDCGNCCRSFWKNHYAGVLTILIPLIFLPILFLDLENKTNRVVYLYCIMAIYWLTKAIPIYVTGMLPAMLFPIMGVLNSNDVCMLYFHDVVVLFFGGTLMGLAMEYSNLHKRIALKMLKSVGTNPKRILWTLTFSSMLLSMWMSNTTTTGIMCTIVRAIVDDLNSQGIIKAYEESEKDITDDSPKASRIASCFYISVAFAASIGGTGSLLGTTANMALKGIYLVTLQNSTDYMNFTKFIIYTWPMVVLLTIFLCIWMQLLFLRNMDTKMSFTNLRGIEKFPTRTSYNELGPITAHEIQVIILFALLIVLFLTMRTNMFTGWADFLNEKTIRDSWPVIFIGLLLFTLPMHYQFCRYVGGKGPFTNKEVQSILGWKFVVKNMPWGYIFLIGGGLALATGISKFVTNDVLIQHFSKYYVLPYWCVQLLCIVSVVVLTTFTWNIIAVNLAMPIIAALALSISIHPLYLMFPAGLAASFAFLTPFGTPPNELIINFANIRIKYMLLAGIGPTIVAILLVFVNGNTWHRLIYPEYNIFPTLDTPLNEGLD